jgi:hypothetical protein
MILILGNTLSFELRCNRVINSRYVNVQTDSSFFSDKGMKNMQNSRLEGRIMVLNLSPSVIKGTQKGMLIDTHIHV